MRTRFLSLLAGIIVLGAVTAGQTRLRPLTVVPALDPYRYMGTWFEMARLPNPAQRRCSSDVTSTFDPRPDGRFDVSNRCREKNGHLIEVTGIARPVSGHPSSSLRVRFGSSFLGVRWDDYQIIELGENYEFAVVGSPDRKRLWVLSRQPRMDDDLLRDLVERARAQMFDVDALTFTRHTTS
jgi:apolipoprotein D and lipocalin family protein